MIGNCLMCDTLFVNVVGIVNLSERKGAKGKNMLDDQVCQMSILKYVIFKYEKLQERFTDKLQLLHCPTCSELVYDLFFFMVNYFSS